MTVEQLRTGNRQSTRFGKMRWAGGSLRQRLPRPHEHSAQLHAARDTKGVKMRVNSKDFRVRSGKNFDLREWPTTVKPF